MSENLFCDKCGAELKEENRYRNGLYSSVYECSKCGELSYFMEM